MRQLFFSFLKIGATTFGGGYAMLPVIRQEVVLTKRWLTSEEFVDVLAIAQSSPGAVAINTAIFIGFKMAGVPGAFSALLGTVLPSFLIILLIAGMFAQFAQYPQVLAAFAGIRPAIAALIAAAVVKLGKPVLKDRQNVILTVFFLLLAVYADVHPALVIILGALTGITLFRTAEKEKTTDAP
jgi:chromate transporter